MTAPDSPIVFIVDDDTRMRAAMQRLLKTVGLRSESFGAPEEFLRHKLPNGPSCLVLDVRLPGMSGLDVQRKLTEVGVQIPVIFITAQDDPAARTAAEALGCAAYFHKTTPGIEVLDAIRSVAL